VDDEPPVPPWLAAATLDAHLAARRGDADTAIAELERIIEAGALATALALNAWSLMATVGLDAAREDCAHDAPNDDSFWSFRLVGGQVDEQSADVWAARFITASANHDHPMQQALFSVAVERGASFFAEACMEVMHMTASMSPRRPGEWSLRAQRNWGRACLALLLLDFAALGWLRLDWIVSLAIEGAIIVAYMLPWLTPRVWRWITAPA
jgi:hypothetical protein